MTRGEFADAVYTYCLLTGGSTTSGIRSTKRNAAVGGVAYSPHRFGLGQDVVYDDYPSAHPDGPEIAKRLGLRVLREGDHDHLQPADWIPG